MEKEHDHYEFDEISWANQMLAIKPGSLSARKLAKIGVDIAERHETARKILKEHENEQSVQNS